MAKILRINMSQQTVTEEEVPTKYKLLGGRGLTSNIVLDEVPPTCHPLGPNNKLVFAPGVVTGSAAASSGRISVGAKSPLTGGIKESNAGTPVAQMLGRLRIKAVIVEGEAPADGWWVLKINSEGANLVAADELEAAVTSKAASALFEENGKLSGVVTIGPAGENKMAMSGICFNDADGRATRYAGRGGLGAVMGSKRLKAIVVDPKGAPGVEINDRKLFREGERKLLAALQEHDITKPEGTLNTYGTDALVNVMSEAGGLPTRNFSTGSFEGANNIGGETLQETIAVRGGAGQSGHSCHQGCVIMCSNVWAKKDGSEHVSVVEYESAWALGANCGIDDLDEIAEMINLCNEYGVDTIEAGVTIGVAMEGGAAEFGDSKAAIQMLHDVGKATPQGRILGNGAEFTGQAFGVTRVPTVKGQAMPAYEPRAVKGLGVTYATSPQGADHTAGYTVAQEILGVGGESDPLSIEGKADLSRASQAASAWIDTFDYCLFVSFAILDLPSGLDGIVESVNGVLGTEYTADDINEIGMNVLRTERLFNERAGFTNADDRLPEFMAYEQLPPHNVVADVPDAEMDAVFGSM
ncbi:MAG: aldehyde ferredoxin oxidoreductase C-terminal domain-containing protein [Dehalococcoidia bacterium]|mgnify:CR=1 FL=1|nr:aldehyde ferredoxin oxidoreductase [Chloroflexota bacterium]MDP6055693.1 aldehyde ferredoxin oxidoreductase C-terminal domain-containing protein [Dehalococcoidia bacterium]MDP7484824.1 aldehyde ferredoxin oxidoreductase C-terminal domain-containing protein [Dehalococcoidia bacterium]